MLNLNEADFDTIDEARMEVMINGRATGWWWIFAGPGHPKTQEMQARLGRERLARERLKEQQIANGRKWVAPKEDIEELRAQNIGIVADRLLGWTEVTMDGAPFPFTPENARRFLGDPKKGPLLAQCLDFISDDSVFTHRSATASEPSPSVTSSLDE